MTADGLVRLAELRRRQGRLVEAAELFDAGGAASAGVDRRARRSPSIAAIAQAAAELAERYLRRLPPQNRTERAAGLELLVRALVRPGDMDGARTALAELTDIATLVETLPLRGVGEPRGRMRRRRRPRRPNAARRHFEDAVDLFRRAARRSRWPARASSWRARWPRWAGWTTLARRRSARSICSPS